MTAYQPRPGDIGLSGIKAQGVVSLAIKLGSVLRHEDHAGVARIFFLGTPPVSAALTIALLLLSGATVVTAAIAALVAFVAGLVFGVVFVVVWAAILGFRARDKAWFSHSFIVHHVDPDGTVWITEAHASGVQTVRLHYRPGDYVWLRTSTLLTGDDVDEMRALLDSVTAARWKYDYRTFAGLAVYAITGAFLAPARVGTAICSGLTSEALVRGRAIWPLTAYRMMPQDQHTWAAANDVAIVDTGSQQ